MVAAFVQSPDDFLQGPQNAGSYAPQPGAIFGVLKNMEEAFEANLAAAQKEESDSQRAYRELKAAKESEIAAGTKQIETKTIQMGKADQKKAESTQDLEDTTNTMEADQEFLGKLKEHCALATRRWRPARRSARRRSPPSGRPLPCSPATMRTISSPRPWVSSRRRAPCSPSAARR